MSAAALRITRNYFKLHSACALTHSALDATVHAWSRLGFQDPGEVDAIDVATVANNLRVDGSPAERALHRFSLPYAVAAAILTGETGPSSFEWRADVADLATRVHVVADPDLDAPGQGPLRRESGS